MTEEKGEDTVPDLESSKRIPLRVKTNLKTISSRITAIYVVAGLIWVIVFDKLAGFLIREHALSHFIDDVIGCVFIVVTAILVFRMTRTALAKVGEAEGLVKKLNEGLENKVAERSDELYRVNQQLEQTNTMLEEEISEREKAEKELNSFNRVLENRVTERTVRLEEMNEALEEINAELVKTNSSLEEEIRRRIQMQIALHESEQQFRKALEEAPIPILLQADDGEILRINKEWTEITGYSHVDIPTVSDWVDKAFETAGDREEINKYIRNLFQSEGRQYDGEYAIKTRNGDARVWDFYSARIGKLQDGRYTSLWLAIDITERRAMEVSLRKNEERYRAMFQNMTSGVAVYQAINDGEHFIFKDVNEAAEKMGNFKREEVTGRNILEIYPNIEEFGLVAALRRVYKTGKAEYLPPKFYKDAKREGWRDNSIYQLPSGEVAAIYNNVTQQMKAEQDLKISEERLRLAMEATSDGLWDWDLQTGSFYTSPRTYEMLGYEPGPFAMEPQIMASFVHPDDLNKLGEIMNNVINSEYQEAFTVEYRIRTKDGQWKWVSTRGKCVKADEKGRALRLIGTHQDLTDRKQIENELRLAKEQAEAANKAKSQFLANMSHEIRTPMNGIIGMTDLTLMTGLTAEQKEYIGLIKKSSDSLLRIINDILDYSKIEAGKIIIENNPFDIKGVVNEVVALFTVGAMAKGLEIKLAIDPAIPDRITGDNVKLRQILSNLLGNSVKFTSKGSISITAESLDCNEGKVKLKFTVSDTGIGIGKDKQALLFERFTQLDSSYSKQFQGTGLGLAISKKLVEMLGGEIWVESDYGKGSSFSFTAVFSADSAGEAHKHERGLSEKIGINKEFAHKKVLIVEDDEASRFFMQTFLRKNNIDFMVADDGEKGLKMFDAEKFDLVLMDVQMPVLDGISATRAIRGKEVRSGTHTPIVGITGYALTGDREICMTAGMDGYISKPIDVRLLYDTMNKYLGSNPENC